jgi:CRP/FNR family transcriptional regulator, cyclic AMP receptor protein
MSSAVNPDTLHMVPLFRGMNESEFRQIVEVMRVREFGPGELVVRQGDNSRDLWVLLEGQCEVVRQLKPGKGAPHERESLLLAVLEPHTHFGEMSFFHPAPHSADVRTRSQVKLMQITHTAYGDMIQERMMSAYKLAYNVVQQMAERLRRMDEWIDDLANNSPTGNVAEWSNFRNRVFNGWSVLG